MSTTCHRVQGYDFTHLKLSVGCGDCAMDSESEDGEGGQDVHGMWRRILLEISTNILF